MHGLLDVAWSLAIEEQFYLVWALVVFLCPPQRLWIVCAAIIIAEPIARNLALNRGADTTAVYVLTWFRLDGLATGALARVAGAPRLAAGARAMGAGGGHGGDGRHHHGRDRRRRFVVVAAGDAADRVIR